LLRNIRPFTLTDVDQALDAVGERLERADEIVPVYAEVEREVVPRPGRNADERQAVCVRGRRDGRQRPVAARDAECIRAVRHRLANERCQAQTRPQDGHADPAFARTLGKGSARSLAAPGRRVHEQHGPFRRIGRVPAVPGQPPTMLVHGSSSARRGSELAARRDRVESTQREKGAAMADMENVVVVGFGEASKAYQALTVLKQCDAEGRIALRSAAIVERTSAGELRIPEGTDNVGLVGTASGSLMGMLIGVLGGPVGVLVGWGSGALMGSLFDIARAEKSDEALAVLGRAVPPDSTAVIAGVEEPAVEVIDGEMAKLGGDVTRQPLDEVMSELEAAEYAAEVAADEARRALREERKAKVSADFNERVGNMKEKLHVS
jgi:uncharacterized membrane protein